MPARARPAGRPAPPVGFRAHLRSSLREVFAERVSGWRLGALAVVLVVGLVGGRAVGTAVGLDGWAVAGVQAVLAAVAALAVAVAVAYGRSLAERRRMR